jgi:hypothetical protein
MIFMTFGIFMIFYADFIVTFYPSGAGLLLLTVIAHPAIDNQITMGKMWIIVAHFFAHF